MLFGVVYYCYELRWSSSDNTLKEPDASGSFFFYLFYCFSSVGAFRHRFIALYLRCRSAPTLILSAGAVPGKYTPFLYGRYEVTEDLDRPRAFAVERTAAL